MSAALVFVLAAMLLLGGAALAAAARWGMSDFWRQYQGSYVPEDAAQHIQTDLSTTGTNHATIDVKELYYDGRSVYLTVDVTPKSDKLLLIPDYLSIANDGWENLTKEAAAEGEQVKTILEVWRERGYQEAMAVSADVLMEGDETPRLATESMDAVLSEDGTLTISLMAQYEEALENRTALLRLAFRRYDQPEKGEAGLSREAFAEFTTRLPLEVQQKGQRYVSTEPKVFESVGVRVNRVTVDVQPLNIYTRIEFSVVDEEKYAAQDGGLWFEFIDPQSTEESYWKQRLSAGVDTGGSIGQEDTNLFVQEETLGANELHDAYTLRAYNCWDKTRYESHTFDMVLE